MRFLRICTLVTVVFISTTSVFSQNNTGTPYSKYGLGLLPENNGTYTAMGGVSAAMKDNYNINYLNPASYTALDSNRWHFQFGINGETIHIATHKESSNYRVAQNATLNMAFRIYKKLFASFGFIERSDIGYDIAYTDYTPGTSEQFLQHMQGEGGINEFYVGLGWKYKQLAIGVNCSYVFGKIETRQTISIPLANSYYIRSSTNNHLSDAMFTFGAQYDIKLSTKSNLTLGSAFNLTTNLSAEQEFTSYKVGTSTSEVMDDNLVEKGKINFPFRITSGFSYFYRNRWNVAGDYTFQKMSDYKEYGVLQNYNDYNKGALGVSYTPNRYGRYWWQRNSYMVGGYVVKSHINLKEKNINTYAATFGAQIPFISRRRPQELLLGIAFDLGTRGTKSNGLIRESFAKIRVNIAFKEGWFVKRKIF